MKWYFWDARVSISWATVDFFAGETVVPKDSRLQNNWYYRAIQIDGLWDKLYLYETWKRIGPHTETGHLHMYKENHAVQMFSIAGVISGIITIIIEKHTTRKAFILNAMWLFAE